MKRICDQGVEFANVRDIKMNSLNAQLEGYKDQINKLIDKAESLGEDSQTAQAIKITWEKIQKQKQQDEEAEEIVRRGIPGYD